jgi:hypothetical protein
LASQQTYDFPNHIKGDTFNGLSFTVTVNSVALPLAGASIKMELKLNKRPETPVVKTFSTVDNSIVITEPSNGKFQIAKQVIDIPANIYVYDLEITLSGGDVHTYISGKWQILQDITNG